MARPVKAWPYVHLASSWRWSTLGCRAGGHATHVCRESECHVSLVDSGNFRHTTYVLQLDALIADPIRFY